MNGDDERDYAEESYNRNTMTEAGHAHSWVSGMMYVHPEDVHQVAKSRQASGSSLPECEKCEAVYDPASPPL